tara:strand:+ start:5203 stop:7476 length:2274 start_codon:yes stop_codon:yes gene_type:complete
MSTINEVSNKYLKNLVQEVLFQEQENFGFGAQSDFGAIAHAKQVVSARQAVAEKARKRYQNILDSLTQQERFILSTELKAGLDMTPISLGGQRLTLSLKPNKEVRQLIESLLKSKITSEKETSVKTIQDSISNFLSVTGAEPDIFRHTGDDFNQGSSERTSVEYAAKFWDYLDKKYQRQGFSNWSTTMDIEILQIINFRGRDFEQSSFKEFYFDTITELNNKKYGSSSLIVEYLTYSMAKDAETQDLLKNILILLGFATVFISLPAGLGVAAAAFAVEYAILDIAIPTWLGISGSLNFATISKEEVLFPLQDLLKTIPENEEKVSRVHGEQYFNALGAAEEFMSDFIYSATKGKIDKNKLDAATLDNDSNPRRVVNRDEDLINNNFLRSQIKADIRTIEEYIKIQNTISPQEVETGLGLRAKMLVNNLRKISFSPSPTLDSDTGRGAILRRDRVLQREGKTLKEEETRIDTDLRESNIDLQIKYLIFQNRIEYVVGGAALKKAVFDAPMSMTIPYLTSTFLKYYDDWTRNNQNSSLIRRKTSRKTTYMWKKIKRRLSSYGPEGLPHKNIENIIKSSWCLLESAPMFHLMGELESSTLLTLGIIQKSRQSATIASNISVSSSPVGTTIITSGQILRAFSEMIRGGYIGKFKGKIVPPKHTAPIAKYVQACNNKTQVTQQVLDLLESYEKKKIITESFYRKRRQFLLGYKDFYSSFAEVLSMCDVDEGADLPGGFCGGQLPGKITSLFMTARLWNSELG